MTRFRVITILILAVGLASLFPADALWPRLRTTISAHDGIVHATAYGLLSLTACWALWPAACGEPDWRPGYEGSSRTRRAVRVCAVLIGVSVGLSLLGGVVEILQDVLHTNRSLSKEDLIANSAGAVTGSVLWLLLLAIKRR